MKQKLVEMVLFLLGTLESTADEFMVINTTGSGSEALKVASPFLLAFKARY